VTEHHISPGSVREIMLGEESRVSLHIIVQEKQQFPMRDRCSSIACSGSSLIWLFQDCDLKGSFDFTKRAR
jgi:hypothetical protein